MYDEEELLMISALQHLVFCERQCALIHIEQMWAENRFTAEGRVLHEKVHDADTESRGDVRVARGLRLRSIRIGLTGVADVVEFHRSDAVPTVDPNEEDVFTTRLPNHRGRWRPFPVEYKLGRPKAINCDSVQLCAQAICLEEMLNVRIEIGALFYGRPRRRTDVCFTSELRAETESLAARLHTLVTAGITPPAEYSKRCESCSLITQCMPKVAASRRSAKAYLDAVAATASPERGGA